MENHLTNSKINYFEFSIAFLIGILFSILVMQIYIKNNQADISILLNTNTKWEIGKWIEDDFGEITSETPGHDTQYYYLIARNPFGTIFSNSKENQSFLRKVGSPKYRYRRILMPLLAGGGGNFSSKHTFINLILISTLSVGLICASLCLVANKLNLSFLIVCIPLIYPGVWHGVTLLTPDNLCLALSILAFYSYISSRFKLLLFLCCLIPLAKETYLLVIFSLFAIAFIEKNKSLAYKILVSGILPTLLWSIYLHFYFPLNTETTVVNNFKFLGFLSTIEYWKHTSLIDCIESYFNLFLLLLSFTLVFIFKTKRVIFLIFPWIVLAITLSDWVWRFGNNSSRALLPLWVITLISYYGIFSKLINRAKN